MKKVRFVSKENTRVNFRFYTNTLKTFGFIPEESARVNFRFYYDNGDVEDSIYQEYDPEVALKIDLEVFNDSEENITLTAPSNPQVGQDNYHFAVKFPQGLLVDLSQTEIEQTDDWDVGYDPDTQDNYEIIYFLKKSELILTPDGSSKASINLIKFCARDTYQSETANIYLLCGPLMRDSEGGSLEENDPESKAIDIIDRLGKTNIPLHLGFVGSETILNDGESENSLILRMTNINSLNSIKPNISFNADSQLVVSFDAGDASNMPHALAEIQQVQGINITATDTSTWQVQHEANSTEWTVSLQGEAKDLAPGEFIELNLSNIVTGHPTGNTNLYLRYEAIPNYRDGQFATTIEKTPLLFRNGNGSISAKPPYGFKLSSPHSRSSISFILTSEANNNRAVLSLTGSTEPTHGRSAYIVSRANSANEYATDLGFKVRGNGSWQETDIQDALTIQYDRKVGIGTTTPSATLHVGGTAIIDDNVGIGTTTPAAKLHVSGNTRLGQNLTVDGELFFGNTTKQMINLWDNKYGIGVQNNTQYFRSSHHFAWYSEGSHSDTELDSGGGTTQMVIKNDKVGIGTSSPQSKLHVSGTVEATNLKIGSTTIGATELSILKKLASDQLTVRIRSPKGYVIQNYKSRNSGGDRDRTIQFSSSDEESSSVMRLDIVD